MKKNILIILSFCMIFSCGLPLYALLADYTFNQTSNTYTEITGGITLGDETTDDQRFLDPSVPLGTTVAPYTGPGLPIGFNFLFNDFVFDVIAINANGWITFGQSSLGAAAVDNSSTSINAPLPSTVTTVPPQLHNRVAGFARDLTAQAGASLRMETIGTQPNRICIIQWKNYKRWGTAGVGDTINFQIQLHEHMNKVVFTYGVFRHGATAGTYFPQVGMRGIATTDFVNRTTTTNWAATTAGTVNTANCTFSTTCYPPRGLTFEYYNQPVYTDDLQALSVTGNLSPYLGSLTPYTVTIRNNGTNPQSDYTVKLMNGTTEIDSVAGPTIEAGSTADVVLNWTPAAVGAFQLAGLVVLAGDQDSMNNLSPELTVSVLDVVYGTLAGVVKIGLIPIGGATITAGAYQTTTAANGGYTMQVAVGTYAVTCSAAGYITQTIENVIINQMQTTILNFNMVVPNDDEVQITAPEMIDNYPNPFNTETTIRYFVKGFSPVKIEIYNTKGQLVKTLVNENKSTGEYQITWNGRDDKGKAVAGGVYHCKMQSGVYNTIHRMLLLR